jgi:hypothetical protein
MSKQELITAMDDFHKYDTTYLILNAQLYDVTYQIEALRVRTDFILSILDQLIDKLPENEPKNIS